MEEKKYILFRQVWLGEGLAESVLNAKKVNLFDLNEFNLTALVLLETEIVGKTTLRTIKLMFDFGGVKTFDTAFLMFFASLFKSLSNSDVKLCSVDISLHDEFKKTVEFAKVICDDFEESIYTNILKTHVDSLVKYSNELSTEFLLNHTNRFYEKVINLPETDSPVVEDEGAFYFRKYYNSKIEAQKRLKNILTQNSRYNPSDIQKAYNEVFNGSLKYNVEFNLKQKIASVVPLLKRFSVISGGPGTGKTSIIFQIIRVYCEIIKNESSYGVLSEDNVKLCAPTARAAIRMKESLENYLNNFEDKSELSFIEKIESSTIHRLVQVNSNANKNNSNLDADLIIVDEASMIDIKLFSDFINRIGPNSSVVLIGDRNQLPSVEAGAVLGDLTSFVDDFSVDSNLTFSIEFAQTVSQIIGKHKMLSGCSQSAVKQGFGDNVVVLTHSYRSSMDIIKAAEFVNISDFNSFFQILKSSDAIDTSLKEFDWLGVTGVKFVKRNFPQDSAKSLRNVLKSFARFIKNGYMKKVSQVEVLINSKVDDYPNPDDFSVETVEKLKKLFIDIESFKILTLLRESLFGCSGVNSVISSYISPLFNLESHYSGLPVMVRENDYSRQLFNSDTGICLFVKNKFYVFFIKGNTIKVYNSHNMPLHTQAWAITVHKSQGSEYERVLLVMPEHDNRLLSKEIVYTAVTRSKKAAVIFSKEDILKKAVERKIERNSAVFS